MKQSDLYREWARVLDMCDGTKVMPTCAWKFNGIIQDDCLPNFEYDSPEHFEFLVAILEDKPVFVGDTIYVFGAKYTVVEGDDPNLAKCSWQPPKKKVVLK